MIKCAAGWKDKQKERERSLVQTTQRRQLVEPNLVMKEWWKIKILLTPRRRRRHGKRRAYPLSAHDDTTTRTGPLCWVDCNGNGGGSEDRENAFDLWFVSTTMLQDSVCLVREILRCTGCNLWPRDWMRSVYQTGVIVNLEVQVEKSTTPRYGRG